MADLGSIVSSVETALSPDQLLTGVTIRVDSTLAPFPIILDLTPDPNDAHTFAKIAKPSTTISKDGVVLYSSAPYGDPAQTRAVVLIGVLVVLYLLAVLIVGVLK